MGPELRLTVFLSSSSSFWISAIRLQKSASSETKEHTLSCLPVEKMVLSCKVTCQDGRIANRVLDIAPLHCIWPSFVGTEYRNERRERGGYRNWGTRGLQGQETLVAITQVH